MKKALIAMAVVLIVGAVVGLSGFAYGYKLENNDAFCASCHTEPESTYYQRSQADAAGDLASFHKGEETRCIDCHSGEGLSGRAQAMAIGARDWLAFKRGVYRQPAITTRPEGNDSCTKCHSFSFFGGEAGEGPSIDGIEGHDGHYHTGRLLVTWDLAGGPKNGCSTCHPGHVEMTSAQFLTQPAIDAGCRDCHTQLGEGGEGEGGDD